MLGVWLTDRTSAKEGQVVTVTSVALAQLTQHNVETEIVMRLQVGIRREMVVQNRPIETQYFLERISSSVGTLRL